MKLLYLSVIECATNNVYHVLIKIVNVYMLEIALPSGSARSSTHIPTSKTANFYNKIRKGPSKNKNSTELLSKLLRVFTRFNLIIFNSSIENADTNCLFTNPKLYKLVMSTGKHPSFSHCSFSM